MSDSNQTKVPPPGPSVEVVSSSAVRFSLSQVRGQKKNVQEEANEKNKLVDAQLERARLDLASTLGGLKAFSELNISEQENQEKKAAKFELEIQNLENKTYRLEEFERLINNVKSSQEETSKKATEKLVAMLLANQMAAAQVKMYQKKLDELQTEQRAFHERISQMFSSESKTVANLKANVESLEKIHKDIKENETQALEDCDVIINRSTELVNMLLDSVVRMVGTLMETDDPSGRRRNQAERTICGLDISRQVNVCVISMGWDCCIYFINTLDDDAG